MNDAVLCVLWLLATLDDIQNIAMLTAVALYVISDIYATSLSECEQVIFDMYYKGESYLQIAQALGKNTKYVDNTLQRIRKKIKANLPNSD